MFGVEAVPAILFFLLLFFNPSSPRWLIANGKIEDSKSVLEKCGTDSGSINDEIDEIKNSLIRESSKKKESLLSKKYMKPILLAVSIAMFNQLLGINTIMYYAPHIFKMAGAGESLALLKTVAVGGTNLIFTMLALFVIDHFGRKKLMLIGSIGYIISLGATAYAFYSFSTDFS